MSVDQVTCQQRLIIFQSPIGWIGISHRDMTIEVIKIGFPDSIALCQAFRELKLTPVEPDDQEQQLIAMFEDFFGGNNVNFEELQIELSGKTEFQRAIIECCRAIPFGQTLSYGELAAIAGRPKAARAVGTVMRKNNFPIVVPCHRVVASNGLGGFTSPQGCKTKIQLQAVEAVGRKNQPR